VRRLQDLAATVTHTAPWSPWQRLYRQHVSCCASTNDFPSAKELHADLQRKDDDIRRILTDLQRKDEDIRAKDEDIRGKDAVLEDLHARVHLLQASALQLEKKNATALRLAGVVTVRSALEVVLHDALPAKGEAAFVELLQSQLGAQALACCNSNVKVVADNGNKPHTVETLARTFQGILKRLHKDTHVGKTAQAYIDSDDCLVLSSNGLSASDVTALACLFQAHRYPVIIEGSAQTD